MRGLTIASLLFLILLIRKKKCFKRSSRSFLNGQNQTQQYDTIIRYEYHLICIFNNINENIRNMDKL